MPSSRRLVFPILAWIGLALSLAGPARASVIYSLGASTCTTACGGGGWGTVTVSQDATNGAALDVVVQLGTDPNTGSPYYFHASNNNHFFISKLKSSHTLLKLSNLSDLFITIVQTYS